MWKIGKNYKNTWEYMYLRPIIEEALKYLKLPSLELEIDNDFDNCQFYYADRRIVIGLQVFDNINFDYYISPYIPKFIKSYSDKLRFVVYHEIAHYIQIHKHIKWYNIFSTEYSRLKILKLTIAPWRYRKLKKEANADKIAIILFNKFKNKGEIIWKR